MPSLKNLPTLSESGLKNFEVSVWHGLYAPKSAQTDCAVLALVIVLLPAIRKTREVAFQEEGQAY